ncbi:hypothetical protein AAG570_008392 [Ranatra chinensis]|uniref:Myrosinase 1 n=1 Tax=Ranatra chinensis TaxID=642074 RepID=A0ABD0Z7V5_9HEMI
MKFPKHFIFSTASAAYQIEGGWNEDGKGENIWDRIVHSDPNYIQDHSNADVTCDSYHKYKEDIKCIRKIGFKAYRFSLSWARILPTGDITRINKNGIKYYMDLIDELIKNDIQPMVTLYHWDLPQTLQNLGGWLNPIIADYFEDFAYLVFSIYGNKVKWWITINEPSCIASGYGGVDYAPAMHLNGIGEYLAGHTLIKAHAKVYRLYENHFKSAQKGKISFALNGAFGMPVSESEEDVMAAERYNQFEFGWFAHPIYSNTGDYPPVMRDTVDRNSAGEGRRFSRLPSFTNEEIEFIKGTYDFIGINHYTSRLCTTGSEGENPSRSRDTKVKTSVDPNWPPTGVSWNKVVPEGLRKLLNWLKNEYGNLTVFITENGYSDNTTVLHDKGRIEYYKVS